jgi:hypothetical protein
MNRKYSDVTESVVRALCESIDTPRSLSVWLCFKYNHEALVELAVTDFAEQDVSKFQLDYFITEYLSKYSALKLPTSPSDVALKRWKLSEQQCMDTNRRFKSLQQRPFTGRVDKTLFRAQRKIAAVLGPLSLFPSSPDDGKSVKVSTVLAGCKWGPGATFDISRKNASPDKKISQVPSVTIAALPYFRAVLESDPHWGACLLGVLPWGPFSLLPCCFSIVRGSRVTLVPKSAKTDRPISVEPTGNSFLQQGVHSYMRRRLRRFGINLDDQSISQRGALEAYSSKLSTLDLSAASDTISREIVYHLLPLDWALFLDSLRSKETQIEGKWVLTEKFASMGNAFCFELETLIFWALASSVDEVSSSVDKVTVYGDDIVIPREAYDSVEEILTVCGFTLNRDKSHRDGYFFESCGKHYFKAQEVTPVYQKHAILHPSELIRAHNRLVRLATRLPADKRFIVNKALKVITSKWPLRPFPRIPFGAPEDGGFLRPLSEFSLDRNHGYRCHVFDFVTTFRPVREDAMYAYKLRRAVNQNPLKTGHAGHPTEGTWRTRVRWISEATILDGSLE